MRTLSRYIGFEIIKGSAVSIAVLLTVYNFVTFSDELDDLGKGNYGLKQIFEYLALTSPRNFYELMPSAALIGTLFTLGAFGSHRELLAMRLAGASLFRLIRAVLQAGAVLVIVAILVGELIAPDSERSAQLLKASALKKQLAMKTKYGFWMRDANTFINVRTFGIGQDFGGISIYEFEDDHRLLEASHAEQAEFINGLWHLKNLNKTQFKNDRITAGTEVEATLEELLDPELLAIVVVKPENLSILGLVKYVDFLKQNGQRSQPFEVALWSRLANPFATLIMVFIALPFVFRLGRVMNTGQRIVVGVLIGLGFNLFDRTFSHLGLVYDLNPVFAAVFPAGLFLCVAIAAIRKYCY